MLWQKIRMEDEMAVEDEKSRFGLWIKDETLQKIEPLYKENGCRTKSEFIEKAVNFYCEYLSAEGYRRYLPESVTSIIKGTLDGFEGRMASLLFKLSVETAMMMHVTAANNEIDEETLSALRGMCVEEVKRLYGRISFEDVVRFQKE